ncbi:hypothetical protein [Pseudomonas aeruginosa]|uniref:hypothetical protein n=1 Tax=Pseudomonas aeruginosa TaxID=287 RepID=UPI000CCBFB2A|nr:hypothetical protein [Pseudomonas aeruginosa]PNP69368.1 hypothetical protein AL481_013660 [Pseudomonas aeruginosa]
MRDRMAEAIINQPGLKQSIENQKITDLLPEQSLQWITNNKRQNAFIIRKLTEKTGINYIGAPDNLTGRDLTIAAIDIWQTDKSQKSETINQIRSEWKIHTEPDHLFKWFDDLDEKEKLNTAWKITKDKYSFLVLHQNQPQERDDFIILLDSILITTPEKILLMNSIKKRWSQNKYRAKNTGKKQYNFILSDKTIKRLDKLADKHDLKRTQVLDILLKMEEEKGIYIQERLKQLVDS